jgi:hypothetical protein
MSKLSEFNVKDGNWQSYCDRLDMYFTVNNVKEELKLPTLIAFMGEEAYELLVNLASPRKPAELTLEEVKKVMLSHLQPSPSFLAERYKFRQRRQCLGESILVYVAELKKLSRFCEFGSSLDDNLRDQFACGIWSDVVRQRLFAEGKITFGRAVSVASALEAAERDAAAVGGYNSENMSGLRSPAVRVSAPYVPRLSVETAARRSSTGMELSSSLNRLHVQGGCLACGEFGHKKNECRFKTYECNRCGKVGHLRRVCQQYEMSHNPRPGRGGNHRSEQRGRRGAYSGTSWNHSENSRRTRSATKFMNSIEANDKRKEI